MASDPLADRLRRRPQLSDEVASILRHKIMTAEHLPGDRIRIDETATALGVSVTPVREALLTLRSEGMVHLAPHRGYEVARLTPTDVDDLFWIQGEAAARIARRNAAAITTEQIDELEWANSRLRAAIAAGDRVEIAACEFEFHRTHNQVSDNEKLAWILNSTTRYTPHELFASDPTWGEATLARHEALIGAYRDADADGAAAAIRLEFTDGAQRLTDHLRATEIWRES